MQLEERAREETILVVDDNPLNRLVLEGFLAEAGYAVLQAENGKRALEVFAENDVDLVLLDVAMPVMDGFGMCKSLRATSRGADVPVLFVTALGDFDTHARAIDSGGDDFLSKPVQRIELLLRAKSLLRIKRLENDLAHSNRLLGCHRDALLRAHEEKRRLTEMIVHDLRGPLACVLGSADFVLEDAGLSEPWGAVVRDIYRTADAMSRMVNDLLDVARSEDGVLIPHFDLMDLADLLEDIRCYLRAREKNARHKLILDDTSSTGIVEADKDLFRRVVENLVENAIKYAPVGTEIRLEVSVAEGDRLLIRLHDHGPGVPEEYRRVIFEPYVHRSPDKKLHLRTSRGLGLAFCRLAVEAHGGEIWVEDNPPNGSLFCFWIPKSRDVFCAGKTLPVQASTAHEGEPGRCTLLPAWTTP